MDVSRFLLAALCAGSLLTASCVQEEESSAVPATTTPTTTGGRQPPPIAQEDDPAVLGELQALEKQQADYEAAYRKNPKDAKLKTAYTKATNALAHQVMAAVGTLGPRQAYPRALRLYRQVVAVDPSNAEAKEWIVKIEDIYKSMGRPIPEG